MGCDSKGFHSFQQKRSLGLEVLVYYAVITLEFLWLFLMNSHFHNYLFGIKPILTFN